MQEMFMEDIYHKTTNNQIKTSKLTKLIEIITYQIEARHIFYSLKKAAKKADYSDYIEKNANICNGEAVIKGTRIRPITIYNYCISNCKKYQNFDLYVKGVKQAYPVLDDEKILYAWLYCIKKMSFKKFVGK